MKIKGIWLFAPVFLLLLLAGTILAFGLPLGESLRLLFDGALGDRFGLHRTLLKATPLIFVAVGMVIAWRAGMFNIGGEGQLLAGVCAGVGAAHLFSGLNSVLLSALILVVCVVAGALYAGIAAWLYAVRGVNVVISTILLNFLTVHLASYLVRGPLQEPSGALPQTTPIGADAMFAQLDSQTGLHAGVFLVPVVCLAVWLWLQRTRSGFRLRLTGANPWAARAARVPVVRVQVSALVWSGALCGLAGGVELLGVSGYLFDKFSPGWGFLGIPVALLGGLHPLGVLLSGLYFGALFAGSRNLEAFGAAGSPLVFAIQGAAVLGFAAFQEFSRRRAARSAA